MVLKKIAQCFQSGIMQFLNQHTSKYQKRSKHFVCTRLPGMPPVPPDYYACSHVKCDLFKAFCCNMYCSHLWSNLKNDALRRLIVGYNHSFRIIMKYSRHCSASGMFVFSDVPSFTELWRKSIYGFKQRVDNSLNKVVNTVAITSLLSSNSLSAYV